jgi:diguanylate cyclase (GGDEF)-like protein
LLHRQEIPSFPEELKTMPLAEDIHRELCDIRQTLERYAAWDLESAPESAGVLAKYLKAVQANYRHIVWRIRMALHGGPEDSPGTAIMPFNEMARQLEQALQARETDLRRKTGRQQATIHELQERESRFRSLASRDPLTGTLNRSSFIQRAIAELETVYIHKTGACLAIIDLDHFKEFNDQHGHLAGDEALKHLVEMVSGTLRQTDFMGRYGGEEFVVFFPDTKLEIGHRVCERLLRTLASKPVQTELLSAPITASIGLTQMGWEEWAGQEPGYPDFSEEWIYRLVAEADRALYQAKKEGRNRVVSYYGERDGESGWNGKA